jgi:hypothetical protein
MWPINSMIVTRKRFNKKKNNRKNIKTIKTIKQHNKSNKSIKGGCGRRRK